MVKEYRHQLVPKHLDLGRDAAEEQQRQAREAAGLATAEAEEAPAEGRAPEVASGEDGPSTMMLRNIPNRYTRDDLLAEMEELGLAGTFDFFYLPLDQCRRHKHHGCARKMMSNLGYAFVNFVDARWARRCQDQFQDRPFTRHRLDSRRVADVCVAHIQGLKANLAHYERAAVSGAKFHECRPMLTVDLTADVRNERT
jgi:RNA recognition motif-containing protein